MIEVIWQTMTDRWLCGNTSLWTITAGLGLPKSPGAATVTTSPRFGAIVFSNGFYPCQCVRFVRLVQPRYSLFDPLGDFLCACIGHDQPHFSLAFGASSRSG